MVPNLDEALRQSTIFRRLSADDRQRLAAVASVQAYDKGRALFGEGEASDQLYTVIDGRVKVFKTTARGTDVILELFGPGDPVGAVAVYESRAYPASAVALEPTTCVLIPRHAFFALLEAHPTMVRGLLGGLTHRLVELTNRAGRALWRPHRGPARAVLPEARHRSGPASSRRHVHSPRALAPGARRHDRHDDRDGDSDHEPLGQREPRPHGQGRVRPRGPSRAGGDRPHLSRYDRRHRRLVHRRTKLEAAKPTDVSSISCTCWSRPSDTHPGER